ncbi:hypothetical protein KDL01_31290 [Actinospica durhamensis]|uniref:Uncharacterized protein n=1 Tax=Actinospica durhamensis TaxID=1508375 RepID=A0A941EVP6_9ACTN|nr:hypothetical protein [Actinospica durhamensis]MBR7837801.1 hypothetical protein [Actinospica durhamensis]
MNPYQVFIDVLDHPHTGARRQALTGEMIAVYTEVNHLLARTKGKLAGGVWRDCAVELDRRMGHYRSAWQQFSTGIDAILSSGIADTVAQRSLGPETEQAFQEALDGLCAALDVVRSEARRIGIESWKY